MPPLSHGTPERQYNPELRELINKTEQLFCWKADAVLRDARHTEYSSLSGLNAAFHHRKAVGTESVRYETDEHNGEYGIRAMLKHGGSKNDRVSLLTCVVRDVEEDGEKKEGKMSGWVERISFTGSVPSGYYLSIKDVNTGLLTPEEHLSLLKTIEETVDLISAHHYSPQLETQQ